MSEKSKPSNIDYRKRKGACGQRGFLLRFNPILKGLAFLALLLCVQACNGEGDARFVDFSKTVLVVRPGEDPPGSSPLRVAVGSMISPKETFDHYRQLLNYLGRGLDRSVALIQRKTYGELSELFGKGEIDVAFICSGPYARGKDRYGFRLLATPEVQGSHFYQSYLIVAKDSPHETLEDLKGRIFAFTDPDSLTGRAVPTHWLSEMGEHPERFFGRLVYTYSHDNSILAVARGLVDGAAVDGLVWEYFQKRNPVWTSKTRIIRRSDPFGIPPVVVSKDLAPELKEKMFHLLQSMHEDPEGFDILQGIMIDRFIAPREEWYEAILRLEGKKSDEARKTIHAVSQPQE